MSVFRDVTIEWEGVPYVIPSDGMFGAIMSIEQHITLIELHRMANKSAAFRMSQVAAGYHALLEYAGAKNLTVEEVYAGMFRGDHVQANILQSVMSLLQLMVPPRDPNEVPSGEASRRKDLNADRSSRKHTKRQ